MEYELLQIGIDETDEVALNKFYEQLTPHSIFRVDVVYRYELSENNPSQYDSDYSILGHYSTLENAIAAKELYFDPFNNENIFAYLIKEIPVDHHLEEVSFLTVRSYTKDGLNDECLEDQNLCNAFKGRPKEKIRHQIGNIVECLEGRHIFLGIVAALPPTPEDNFPILDAMDDCYLILPYSDDRDDHFHVPCTHVFTPTQEYNETIIHHLQKTLEERKERIITMKST